MTALDSTVVVPAGLRAKLWLWSSCPVHCHGVREALDYLECPRPHALVNIEAASPTTEALSGGAGVAEIEKCDMEPCLRPVLVSNTSPSLSAIPSVQWLRGEDGQL